MSFAMVTPQGFEINAFSFILLTLDRIKQRKGECGGRGTVFIDTVAFFLHSPGAKIQEENGTILSRVERW